MRESGGRHPRLRSDQAQALLYAKEIEADLGC
jgi:hypothetical protein